MNLYDELKWRGLLKDEAGEDLAEQLNSGKLTFYIGADPTADSLHIGQLPTFLMVERLRRVGHKPIVLVGGATGRVGDPRGTHEREKSDVRVVEHNFEKIKKQMKKLFGDDILVLNNYDWFKEYNYIDFLRDVGKYINVSYMVNKDLIKRQMETGISYAEFSYMLIQGYDYKYIHEKYGANLQFGGSDQWGNLTTGIELIRKLDNDEVYAFSIPLTLDSTGKKIGKSEGNALWLDLEKTSSYELYQYILNFEDSMMETYLKRYTFLNKADLEDIIKRHFEKPEDRLAQKMLAKEVITFLHGKEEYDKAVKTSENLFSGNIKNINTNDLLIGLKSVPHFDIETCILIDLLVNNNICSSRREAREFLSNNSITINGDIVNDENMEINPNIAIDNRFVVIRRGKKKYFIANFKA